MATKEQIQSMVEWLDELRYEGAHDLDVSRLLIGDVGQTVLWLSKHAVGRRHTAHIKQQLHDLREETSSKLSTSRREQLGFDVWDSAVRTNQEIQDEDERTKMEIQKSIAELDTLSSRGTLLRESCLENGITVQKLGDLAVDLKDQGRRIASLGKLLDECRNSITRGEENYPTSDTTTSRTIQDLLNQIRAPELLASANVDNNNAPVSMGALEAYQSKVLTDMRTALGRHTRIHPPSVHFVDSKIASIQSHCLELNGLQDSEAPLENLNRRECLLQYQACTQASDLNLATSRKDKNQLELSQENYDTLSSSCQEMIRARRDIVRKIMEVQAQTYPEHLEESQQLLATSAGLVPSALESRRLGASQITAVSPPVVNIADNEKKVLAAELRTALVTSHHLSIYSKPEKPISPRTTQDACDRIAASRFALESLKPSLEAELKKEHPPHALEEFLRLRAQFVEGRLLPISKGADGRTLAEKLRRVEKQTRI